MEKKYIIISYREMVFHFVVDTELEIFLILYGLFTDLRTVYQQPEDAKHFSEHRNSGGEIIIINVADFGFSEKVRKENPGVYTGLVQFTRSNKVQSSQPLCDYVKELTQKCSAISQGFLSSFK